MILQTLYQQCIKHSVEFYNEFYVLDLLMTAGECPGRWPTSSATGEIHSSNAKSVVSPPAARARSSRRRPTPTP
jgi:succinate dehydrogenase / fumarate reductase flavoprotein subunit